MNKKRSLSGIRCSGIIHIGNYLGAIKNWVVNQNKMANIYFLADLHALTTPIEPKKLRENTYQSLALYLACGIDPNKSIIFLQSQVPAHAELTWILNTVAYMGELRRMTQFKDKSAKTNTEKAGVGLFDYPVLMAADILLYQTDLVPIGEDQLQHVELARVLARRFNHRYGEVFKIPEPQISRSTMRIMGLDNPEKKMSKSAESEYNYIALTDSPESIKKKISKAVTDSQQGIIFDPKRAGLYNLLTIYQAFSGLEPKAIEKKFAGKGYGDFKTDLSQLIIAKLAPIQEKYQQIIADKTYLDKIFAEGAARASKIANVTLKEVKNKVGLI
ncbi:MAG: tryptophan--tRNA ligase [Patescibacteria group bacterium]|nr:tryptophan--tRNA ligase [Patescibacteria group bacterium]